MKIQWLNTWRANEEWNFLALALVVIRNDVDAQWEVVFAIAGFGVALYIPVSR